jgi:LmbE family N-acetylglucosaminyl deacetylase
VGTDTQVMLVASHPDDRYVLPAAYLRFRYGYRVAVVLFTRGRGGQNSKGNETGEALARLRTMETEAGAAHLGIKIYYLNRPDGGFCRTAQEALDQWGRQLTTQDLARLVRIIRPDMVMTTHFPGEIHGHDKALLEILPDALRLSADSSFVAEGLHPYRVLRLFRGTDEGEHADITLRMTSLDRDRGQTYREAAYEAVQEHESQRPQLPMEELLQTDLDLVSVPLGGQPAERTVQGVPGLLELLRKAGDPGVEKLAELIGSLRSKIDTPRELLASAAQLLGDLRRIQPPAGSELGTRLGRRLEATRRVVLLAAGVQVHVKTDANRDAVVGTELPLHISVRNGSPQALSLLAVDALNGGTMKLADPAPLPQEVAAEGSLELSGQYTCPNLSEKDLRRLFTLDTFEPPLRLRFTVRILGQEVVFEQAIPKEVRQPFDIGVSPRPLLLSKRSTSVPFVVSVQRNTEKPLDLKLRIDPAAGLTVHNGVRPLSMADQRFTELTFELRAPAALRPGVYSMSVNLGQKSLRVRVHKVDVEVPDGLKVGLIRGADDTVAEVLQSLVDSSRLKVFASNKPLPLLDRESFDTIVVDIRALRSEYMRTAFARLLKFAYDGGRLVVFYHKADEFNLDKAGFRGAPFPMKIGTGRVTREDAPVRVLLPDHVLLNYPNKVRSKDWDGWTQERGLYFPETYDAAFAELLALSDPGLPAERGALLYARYGKGDYIYCALSLYRQLKDLHPGACRLFANLISRSPQTEK